MVYRTREEMLKVLGESLKASRLAVNLSQQVAAEENASTLSLISYCRTLQKTDWLMTLAPPELDASLFERKDATKKRQRAGRSRKEVANG